MRILKLIAWAVCLAGVAAARAASPPHQATVFTINPAIDKLALCNDGTLPKYWFRSGTDGGRRWVIWLEGGGECIDQSGCAGRARSRNTAPLVTSKGFSATRGSGILSAQRGINPPAFAASAVYVHYCTSDAWEGRRAAVRRPFDPDNSATWNFEGRRIAAAAVKTLIAREPSISVAKQIVIGGSSAGGEGITAAASDLVKLLPASAKILFINDAGYALPIGQFDPAAPKPYIYPRHPDAFDMEFLNRLAFWNAAGDSACDAHAETMAQKARCLQSGYLLQNGYITAPMLVTESQLDTAQLLLELCPQQRGTCRVSTNPASKPGIYAAAFAVAMAAALDANSANPQFSFYAPSRYVHELLGCNQPYRTALPFPSHAIAPRDALGTWLATGAAQFRDTATGPGIPAKPLACKN